MKRFFLFSLCLCGVSLVPFVLHAQTAGSASVVTLHVASSTAPNTPPTIVLNGADPLVFTIGDVFTDPGVMASDTEGDDLSSSAVVTGGVGNGSSVNMNTVGTTTLVYTVTDPYNFLSASTTRTVVVNPAPVNPVTPPPVVSAASSGGGQSSFSISHFGTMIGTSSIIIQWTSNIDTVSTISWGTNSDATDGSISEVSPSIVHSALVQGLEPGTMYYLVVHANAVYGPAGLFMYSFVTTPLAGYVAPPNVTNAAASEANSGNGILVSWSNPKAGSSVTGIKVTRGTRFFPRDPEEGYIAYEGNGSAFVDTNASTSSLYYYVIFTKDSVGNYSSGTAVGYLPPSIATSLPTPTSSSTLTSTSTPIASLPTGTSTSTTTPLFGGTIVSAATSSLDTIIFMQDSARIPSINGAVTIKDGSALTIDLPPGAVPKDTEEISVSLLQSTFLFQKLQNGWFEGVVPSAFVYQNPSPFSIHFLSVGSETVISGSLIVPNASADSISGQIVKNRTLILSAALLILVVFVIFFAGIFVLKRWSERA